MNVRTQALSADPVDGDGELTEHPSVDGASLMQALVNAQGFAPSPSTQGTVLAGIAIGELVGLADESVALVRWPASGEGAALRARTIVDLHSGHIGGAVVLAFENSDPSRPIVMGILRGGPGWSSVERPTRLDVTADGERLMVSAKEQLVLRCGKASITLTKAGKVLIEGAYVSSRSTGVNRVKGGSVQLN